MTDERRRVPPDLMTRLLNRSLPLDHRRRLYAAWADDQTPHTHPGQPWHTHPGGGAGHTHQKENR